jgi:hypothetical protein
MNTAEKEKYTEIVNKFHQSVEELYENVDDLMDVIYNVEKPTQRDIQIRDSIRNIDNLTDILNHFSEGL